MNIPKLRLDHLAVWVSDIDKTLTFLTEVLGWKQHPMVVEVSEEEETTGGMKAIFVDGRGLWLELILPTAPGPGMDMLHEFGDGAIVEVNFEAEDAGYREVLTEMEARNVQMLNMDGTPLRDGGRIDEGVAGNEDSAETGQYIAYWPKDLSCGTTIEVYERWMNDETNLLNIRDSQWQSSKGTDSGLRIDHVSILVEDLAVAVDFYTQTMGLKALSEEVAQTPDGSIKRAVIDANSVALHLIQPTSDGEFAELLADKGNGYAMEVGCRVNDLERYGAELNSRDIALCGLNDQPASIDDLQIPALGARYFYLPLEVSRGLRVKVFQD